jgi:hypothetical protein
MEESPSCGSSICSASQEPESSQEPATVSYPDLDEFSPYPSSLIHTLTLSFHLPYIFYEVLFLQVFLPNYFYSLFKQEVLLNKMEEEAEAGR